MGVKLLVPAKYLVPVVMAVALGGCGSFGAIGLPWQRAQAPAPLDPQALPPVESANLPPPTDGQQQVASGAVPGDTGENAPLSQPQTAMTAPGAAGSGELRPHRSPRRLDDHLGRRLVPVVHDADQLDRRLPRIDAWLQQRPAQVDLGVEPARQAGGAGRAGRHAAGASRRPRAATASTDRPMARAPRSPSTAERSLFLHRRGANASRAGGRRHRGRRRSPRAIALWQRPARSATIPRRCSSRRVSTPSTGGSASSGSPRRTSPLGWLFAARAAPPRRALHPRRGRPRQDHADGRVLRASRRRAEAPRPLQRIHGRRA